MEKSDDKLEESSTIADKDEVETKVGQTESKDTKVTEARKMDMLKIQIDNMK